MSAVGEPQFGEVTHHVGYYPRERFFFFLKEWDLEWWDQVMRKEDEEFEVMAPYLYQRKFRTIQ